MSLNSKYVIGIDFGTLSGRAVLFDVKDGSYITSATYDYPNGVIDEHLPGDSKTLPVGTALQNPMDYFETIVYTFKKILSESEVSPNNIIGVGVDFTACSILPCLADSTPLSEISEFKNNPHAYCKIWKDHTSQPYADRLNTLAIERNETFLEYYGGKISSEWMLPKIMEIAELAPEVYCRADYILEAGDWITWKICGVQNRNSCAAGYKAVWNKYNGYPSDDFLISLNPLFVDLKSTKLNAPVKTPDSLAGYITKEFSALTGLKEGTPVAVGIVDGHSSVMGLGICEAGTMIDIIGTSASHMLLCNRYKYVPGICGAVEDGIITGFIGYESGQAGMGDHFQWFVDNALPFSYHNKAELLGISDMEYIFSLVEKLKPGESGLVALDWWNGNRSTLVDSDLSGIIVGMNLRTKPEHILRALCEASAFGLRRVIDNYRSHGVEVKKFCAAGGIAEKNSFLMQLYADILNMDVYISGSSQSAALGAAILASCASGPERGGYGDVYSASKSMGSLKKEYFKPKKLNKDIYNQLYLLYNKLYDSFGVTDKSIMKSLKNLQKSL
ncbi:MAG: ribulokinase [Clostridia bacterium]|nr:ribulokinase [Clostridia bacterium]